MGTAFSSVQIATFVSGSHTHTQPPPHKYLAQVKNHKVPLFLSALPDQQVHGYRSSEDGLDRPDSMCIPSHSSSAEGDTKDRTVKVPGNDNSSRLARDAIVLGPSAISIETRNRTPC